MITGVTEVTEFYTKSDMSRWTRAHADAPVINWSVHPGPGGTMIVVEHEENRSALTCPAPGTKPGTPPGTKRGAKTRAMTPQAWAS